MKYAKIIVKNNYEQRGDLVLRSYIRALKKINATRFLDGDNAYIYGMVDDGSFYEMFTREKIDYGEYVYISQLDYIKAYTSKAHTGDVIEKVMGKLLFNKDIQLDILVSTVQDIAEDNKIEFEAYSSFLSRINPYQRLNEKPNDCNDFLLKIENIKAMKKNDNTPVEDDEYEVLDYIPKEEIEKQKIYRK